jgi:hypothetical protein
MQKIFALVVLIGLIGVMNAATITTTVFAEGQERAPGQSDPNRNPSLDAPLNWCKPGCQSGSLPPGQTAIGNPGQCQKSDGGDFCFEKNE